jgi:hypothetical protein
LEGRLAGRHGTAA